MAGEANERAGLSVERASVRFPIRRGVLARVRGAVHAVENVSLELAPGETVGLAGESGCGKTTLGRAVAGLERLAEGRIRIGEKVLSEAGRAVRRSKEDRRRIQMVFQDPLAALNPRLPVCDLVTEGLAEHGLLGGESREDAAARLLAEVGLGRDALWKYPFEFSGGQRQRICIARAMALRPDWVVCDEVASALDVSVQAQVINLLGELRAKHGVSYLMIGHDLSVLRHVSDRMAVMYLGRLVEVGPADEVVEHPHHPYTQALLSAVPVPGGARGAGRKVLKGEPPSAANPPQGCPFHPRCPMAKEICRRAMPELEGGTHRVACHRAGAAT
jgi:peptide/nickel transport system ATP-binding protein